MDIFWTGLDQLCQAIDVAVVCLHAQVVLFGMEPSSYSFGNLARREKDDGIDAAAIGNLLRVIRFN